MPEDKINELATEIAKCYVVNKTMCDSKEFVELFLDIRDLAKEMIVQRENRKLNNHNIPDDIPEDVDSLNLHVR